MSNTNKVRQNVWNDCVWVNFEFSIMIWSKKYCIKSKMSNSMKNLIILNKLLKNKF